MSFTTRKSLATGLVLMSALVMIVVVTRNEDKAASKREQKLQIDVAFIIHGSKNITSPPRKKTFKEALGWAKKITKAFGEIGVNKTQVGLILYAEKAKLMFNFTEKLDKGSVLGGIEEAGSPPTLGNKTFTGKALKLALKTLVKETRKDAIKKFFVFSDRPPDDDATTPAEAMKEEVEVYGLSGSTAPSGWLMHDFSLDSLYMMLRDGPFKGKKENVKDESYQDVINANIIASNTKTSQTLVSNQDGLPNTENSLSNQGNLVLNPGHLMSNSGNSTLNPGNEVNPGKTVPRPSKLFNPINSKPASEISGSISKEKKAKEEDYTKIEYGKDASVVITENKMKSRNSLGRYSSTIDVNPSATEFGTVIGGVRVNGQSKFNVIKPDNRSENSNLRSKLENMVKNMNRRYKWPTRNHRKRARFRY